MNLIKLNIVGYSHSEFQHGAFALILSEENGNRNLYLIEEWLKAVPSPVIWLTIFALVKVPAINVPILFGCNL